MLLLEPANLYIRGKLSTPGRAVAAFNNVISTSHIHDCIELEAWSAGHGVEVELPPLHTKELHAGDGVQLAAGSVLHLLHPYLIPHLSALFATRQAEPGLHVANCCFEYARRNQTWRIADC
eukprot:TRINITY_DN1110_c0_g1_i1.p3 TRINITY_DN1110_c0_g1~~TRINITY_DN1110_c0_g1_i1.p3  ORF type:complete len:121 (+),score=14.90 TRINITY_DN1110_c0_g1_i1:494-856(+)